MEVEAASLSGPLYQFSASCCTSRGLATCEVYYCISSLSIIAMCNVSDVMTWIMSVSEHERHF